MARKLDEDQTKRTGTTAWTNLNVMDWDDGSTDLSGWAHLKISQGTIDQMSQRILLVAPPPKLGEE